MDGHAWFSRCTVLPALLGLAGPRSLLTNLSRRPGVDIRDQPIHRAPHRKRIVQGRQRIRVLAGNVAIAPAPDPAQLGSLVGVGVKIAQAALGGSGPAGLAALGFGLTTRVKFLRIRALQAQRGTYSPSRNEARTFLAVAVVWPGFWPGLCQPHPCQGRPSQARPTRPPSQR